MRALALILLGVSFSACEKKIEEPVPVRADHPTSETVLAPASADPPAADPLRGRCVKKLGATPARPLPSPLDPKCPKDDEASPKPLRAGKVVFKDAPKAVTADVEIAESDHDRQRGLMFRKKMADDHGMIFVFAEKEDHTFWMHNTCIPLDMLYIDKDGLVVGIEENTPTMSDDTFSVGCKSSYVLEMNAGWARAHGVMPGQFVKLDL